MFAREYERYQLIIFSSLSCTDLDYFVTSDEHQANLLKWLYHTYAHKIRHYHCARKDIAPKTIVC